MQLLAISAALVLLKLEYYAKSNFVVSELILTKIVKKLLICTVTVSWFASKLIEFKRAIFFS